MSGIAASVEKAKRTSITLASLDTAAKNRALKAMADALDRERGKILDANAVDIGNAEKLLNAKEIDASAVDRLRITGEKINGMIAGIYDVAKLEDPVGETMSALELDNDLVLYQVKCPIGLLGVIFESRPDVVPQIMSLCLKSGNSVVFKGGREASYSNRMLFGILVNAASSCGVPKDAFVLMESREEVDEILKMDGCIDLLIPRGSNAFVKYIRSNTKIPVLGHASGICHVYVDGSADIDKAVNVAADSKIQYPAVCNAAETLLVDRDIAGEFLPKLSERLSGYGTEIRADRASYGLMSGNVIRAEESDWDEEYNANILAVKIVGSADEAISFINAHGSGHTDAILAENEETIKKFISLVDSAGVFVNASTRFADGYRYGKGAEVGVSTNKIHARGPVGMEGLMIYKYVLIGNGHMVKDYTGTNAKKYTHRPLSKELRM